MGHEILYIILASLFGLFLTWSVGANDLANVLSPTVGSKAVSMRQVIIIALIFEIAGALLGGSKVATTVQHGIINTALLDSVPEVFIYGMLAALLASSIWITTASHLGIPVSLTNSIVGSVIGFGLLVLGWRAVQWKMVGFIGLSWVLCPGIAGVLAFLFFSLIQKTVLSADDPLEMAKKYLPFFLFLVGIILAEITVIKSFKHFNIQINIAENILIATGCGLMIVLIGQFFLSHIYKQPYIDYKEQFALVEKAFSILVLFTSSAMVYAHGSDDIATATGPVAAVIALARHNPLQNGNTLLLILTCGYFGVIAGFFTFGRKIIATVGSAITELTPSRAFCATIAAASTVIASTNLGIPVSATQTLVGAILGVGLARGIGSIDLRIARNIFMSWFITLPVTAILTALIFYCIKFMVFNI